VIRHAFVDGDLIECVIVLPSKLFYGNNVPACLVVLNKNKPAERAGRLTAPSRCDQVGASIGDLTPSSGMRGR